MATLPGFEQCDDPPNLSIRPVVCVIFDIFAFAPSSFEQVQRTGKIGPAYATEMAVASSDSAQLDIRRAEHVMRSRSVVIAVG